MHELDTQIRKGEQKGITIDKSPYNCTTILGKFSNMLLRYLGNGFLMYEDIWGIGLRYKDVWGINEKSLLGK